MFEPRPNTETTMTNLAYEESGDGTPLVFLHGITMTRAAWRPVVDLLSDTFRCINVDLVGHGESPRTGAYDVFTQANAVGELIGSLGLDRPVLVGHSFGAFTATLLGANAPVRGVVNIDQEMDTASFKRKIAPFEQRLRGDDFVAAFTEFAESMGSGLVQDQWQHLTAMEPDPEIVLGVWTMVFDTPTADLNALVEPVLASYQVPYLAIFGNPVSDEERRLIGNVPDHTIEEWVGLDHFIHLVDPERTSRRIAEFAAGLG